MMRRFVQMHWRNILSFFVGVAIVAVLMLTTPFLLALEIIVLLFVIIAAYAFAVSYLRNIN